MMVWRLTILALLIGALPLSAQEAPTVQYEPAIKPPIKELPDGRLDLGGVIVDPEKMTASFPVRINENSDPLIEYLLVNENGKTHEALLKTSIQPFHLHTAMLLLGIQRAGSPPKMAPPENLDKAWLEQAPPLKGPAVTLLLRDGGKSIPVESLVWDQAREATLKPGQWLYHGSYFQGAAFMAEVDGSLGALISDPAALFSTTDPSRVDDQNWFIYNDAPEMPPPGQVILLEIFLTPPPVDESDKADKLSPINEEN